MSPGPETQQLPKIIQATASHRVQLKMAGSAMLLLTLCLVSGGASSAQAQEPPQPADNKVEKQFYTPKDRMTAIQAALIFTPKAVSEVNILQGPEQDPKQFQF
ncbi:MAG TPA: hypothetical protein VK525_08780, partial [Candidatus Saccharimonadales bacterium]|nr:hypothetical protein [Candidatus Saccharimonadales bacterium]